MDTFSKLSIELIVLLLKTYKTLISPWVGCCRYNPSCCQYSIECFQKHGPFKGSYLTIRRLMRCQPFGRFGSDPVPED